MNDPAKDGKDVGEILGAPRTGIIATRDDTGDGNAGGCLATGMRAINTTPALCAAPPGIVSTLDLPLIPGKGGMRART